MTISSEWSAVARLRIDSGRLSLTDTAYYFEDPLVVDVMPDEYEVAVRTGRDRGHAFVAGIRVLRGEAADRGGKIGSVEVEFGQIGICDRRAMDDVFDALGLDRVDEYNKLLDTLELATEIRVPGDVPMVIVRPQSGGGDYVVRELLTAQGLRCGIEIDCFELEEEDEDDEGDDLEED